MVNARSMLVHSIFGSFQGEGLYVGVFQLFLRLRGCNLACRYCDTPDARDETGDFIFPGEERRAGNPVPVELVVEEVCKAWDPAMHSLALTGGEPLLQADALAVLLPEMKRRGIPVYLETNGTLPGALARLLDMLEYISMDVKLPSALGGRELLPLHLNFLKVARSKSVFIKMVIESSTPREEVEIACRALGGLAPEVPLVLQPATPVAGCDAPSFPQLLSFFETSAKYFREVRVIPQVHRLAGWR